MQSWKKDPKLYDCKRKNGKKELDYFNIYVKEFLSTDPLKDWESIERCKELWNFFLSKVSIKEKSLVLDMGTKDGQFTEWLNKNGYISIGMDIDPKYVEYAKSKNRPVYYGNVCDLTIEDNSFDIIFAHHVLGLCPDYKKAYQEMLRVVKSNGYVITLNQIPGNPKKHFSLINNTSEIINILKKCPDHKYIYFDFWKKGTGQREDEFLVILKQK